MTVSASHLSEPFLRRVLRRGWPWLAAVGSGVLLVLSFPPFDQGWLVWLALLPVLAALWSTPAPLPAGAGWMRRLLRRGRSFLLAYVTGVAFFPATFYWLSALGVLFENRGLYAIPVLLGLYLSLFIGFWGWCVGAVFRRPGFTFTSSLGNLRLGFLSASVWVAQDWVRGWLFSGFGWNSLGVALRHDLPMVQIADLTGVFGLTWLIVFASSMAVIVARRLRAEFGPLFLTRIRWEFSATMLLICGVFAYGVRALVAPEPRAQTPLRVAVLQPNIPEETKKFGGPEQDRYILGELARLHALAAATDPQLIVWPEAAIPHGAMYDEELARFTAEQTQGDFSVLTGSLIYEPVPGRSDLEQVYNAALLFTEHGARYETYRKMHLVPWGEYLPLRAWMPEAIAELVPGDLAFGEKASVLTLPSPALRLGALVCFEDSLGDLTRGFVQAGAQLLVNITNDSWFRETPGAEQHLANATLRAVETRRPLLRCTNTGMTCWINPQGRVERWLKPFEQGFASRSVQVPAEPPLTFYARYGDWVAYLSTLLTALGLTAHGWRAWMNRRLPAEGKLASAPILASTAPEDG